MGFSFSSLILLTLCTSCTIYAIPILEASITGVEVPEVPTGNTHISVAEKREFEDNTQDVGQHGEVPGDASQDQAQDPRVNTLVSLEGIPIPASTTSDTVNDDAMSSFSSISGREDQSQTIEGQNEALEPRARKSKKKSKSKKKKKGCHKTVKKIIQKTEPMRREYEGIQDVEERAESEDFGLASAVETRDLGEAVQRLADAIATALAAIRQS